jgi:hypothetical protein
MGSQTAIFTVAGMSSAAAGLAHINSDTAPRIAPAHAKIRKFISIPCAKEL